MFPNMRYLRIAVTLCGWLLAAVLTAQFGSRESVLKIEDVGTEERQAPHKDLLQTSAPLSPSWTVPAQTTRSSNSSSDGVALTRVPAPPNMVILLTYMRSGSSFTGDVIQQHPDVFYLYEPLHAIHGILHSPVNFRRMFLEKPPSLYNVNDARNLSLEIIENVLTCQLQDLDIISLMAARFVGFSSRKLWGFRACLLERGVDRAYHECLPPTLQACSSSRVSLVKTIRIPMADAGVLMAKYPSLKIIHLIRDPRATVYSQSRTGGIVLTEFENGTREFCQRVHTDLQESRRLSRLYPGRLTTVRYEDLAEQPQEGVAALYNFLGLEFDSERREYVRNHTQMGLPDDCVICTQRANSTATATKWRRNISTSDLHVIQRECLPVFKELGYLPLTSSTVNNTRILSMIKSIPFLSAKG